MRVLSAAVFAAVCLVCVVAGGTLGAVLGNLAVRGMAVGPNGRPAVVAGVGLAVAFGLLLAMYLTAIRPRRNNAVHRFWIVLRRR